MNKPLNKTRGWLPALAACLCVVMLFAPAAHADTDGTELQVTGPPDRLIIQLGAEWAGVEFELRTDVGPYPQPIVVSPEGILTMELGGSTTYTLSASNSTTQAPTSDASSAASDPGASSAGSTTDNLTGVPDDTMQTSTPGAGSIVEAQEEPTPADGERNDLIRGIPKMHLFLFAGGLIACIAGLIILWIVKRRRFSRYDDADEYDDYED